MNPDELAQLEEEQRFLFQSLDDLDREHEAGDVDDTDYQVLRDGYTVRAAAITRAIEAGKDNLPAPPPAQWGRRVAVIVGTIGLIAVVWWALAASSAQRLPGQEITGGAPGSELELMRAQARALQFEQPAESALLYDAILDDDPDDVNALTYGGWTLALAAVTSEGDAAAVQTDLITASEMLGRAIELDPGYPDPYCLRGVVLGRFLGRPDVATDDLSTCLEGDPPADIADLVEGFLATLSDEES